MARGQASIALDIPIWGPIMYLLKSMGISIARRQLPILGHVVVLREKIFWRNGAQNLLDGRSLVFSWVPDGKTKYRRLTKDRGETPKREWEGSHLTPPLDEELSESQRDNRI